MVSCFLLIAMFSHSVCSQTARSVIQKVDSVTWIVDYKTSRPVERIAFKRNPDDSRTRRWRPASSEYRVYVEGELEFIGRKDGKSFTKVQLYLTPTYTHLPKDYAPFSPFSDGGMLIHTGRFFACENLCGDSVNEWSFKLSVPDDEHIIVNGVTAGSEATWVDSDSGRSIYIGHQVPVESNGFLTMVDVGLPKSIKDALDRDIPKITAYFESQLGDLPEGRQPTFFASYSKVEGTSVQGGVLPDQIFIHWDKNDLDKVSEDTTFIYDLLWMFAHEVGHYFQRFGAIDIDLSESWIHEGHAEMLAYDGLTQLYPMSGAYLEMKASRFEESCASDLEGISLKDAAKNGRFQAYYSCGFLIYHLISRVHRDKVGDNMSPYELWKLFSSKKESTSYASTDAFLESVTELSHKRLSESIRRFINSVHDKPRDAVAAFVQQRDLKITNVR